ncbi:helix-turn-helix transcriptional regulator [Microbacterium sp.]|uniref:helix-turn-helix transcriptional regulator n=1 Tax=Microbacterium sp. TaxID=51671 RepID=UPI0039E4F534
MSHFSYRQKGVWFLVPTLRDEGIDLLLLSGPRDWANIVRDRRSDLGLTQDELAQRIGRARQWVVRFESGHAGSASLDNVIALLNALDLYATVDVSEDDPDPLFMDVGDARDDPKPGREADRRQ